MNIRIEAAYQRVDDAENERDRLISETYKPGDMISYLHGRHEVKVTVIRTGFDRVYVESKSKKKYWIGAYRVNVDHVTKQNCE